MGDVARLHRRRRLVSQHLLDRAGDQREVVGQLAPLIRVFGEQLPGEADQPRRGLVACPCDHAGVHQHLGAGQSPNLAVLLQLRVEQLCHQVVGRMVGAPVDVGGEQLVAVLEHVRARPAELALFQRQRTVGGVADRRLVLFGNAEQVADRAHRDLRPMSAMKSSRPEPASGSSARTQYSRVNGSIASIRRGVKTLESKRRCRSWIGGSSNRMMPGGSWMPARMMSIVVPRPDR